MPDSLFGVRCRRGGIRSTALAGRDNGMRFPSRTIQPLVVRKPLRNVQPFLRCCEIATRECLNPCGLVPPKRQIHLRDLLVQPPLDGFSSFSNVPIVGVPVILQPTRQRGRLVPPPR